MICFSDPCGYFVFKIQISISGNSAVFSVRSLMASGLFSSIAMTPLFTFTAFIKRRRPFMTSYGLSSITRWSEVKKGSHSAPFTMTVSIVSSFGGVIFTCVGKPAPPMPTMPASRTAFTICSDVTELMPPSFLTEGSSSSLKSFSMIIQSHSCPEGVRCLVISLTVPETLEWTGALT